ncbi:hypothetical protein RYX36_026370 [Vicia faba]
MQGQTQATQPTEVASNENPEANADVDIEFEMLAANFTATFKATQTQPNLVTSSQSKGINEVVSVIMKKAIEHFGFMTLC